jgi:hypothetical protein
MGRLFHKLWENTQMKITVECDFTPAALDQIEFGLSQALLHLDGNAFPIRADAIQDALEIVCGLRSSIWQTHYNKA